MNFRPLLSSSSLTDPSSLLYCCTLRRRFCLAFLLFLFFFPPDLDLDRDRPRRPESGALFE